MGITLTESGASKIKELVEGEFGKEKNAIALRVAIKGGGCSGMTYAFSFEEQIQEGDDVVEVNGATLLVDPMSLMYLEGATLDYESGLSGENFVIKNPNSTGSCGCGSSFRV